MKSAFNKFNLFFSLLFFSVFLHAQTECNLASHVGINFGPNADDQLYDVKMQDDGKFVAFGSTYYIGSNTFEISICRFLPEGGLDTTYGNKGKDSYKFDSRNTCYAGAIASTGKIYAGGYQAPGNGISTFRPYVARFSPEGVIDSSFGNNGSALLNSFGRGSVIGLHPVAGNKVLVAIINGSPAAVTLVRLKNDGTYDSTFATNGISKQLVTNFAWQVNYGTALFKQDGKIVFIGKTLVPTQPCIVQFNANGSLDTNFANKGIQIIPRNIRYNFANIHGTLDNNQQILVSATAESPSRFAMWRLQHNGLIDSTFGTNGLSMAKTTSFSEARGVAVHPVNNTIIQYGVGGSSGRRPALFYTDMNGNEIGGCKNDTFEIFNLGYAFGHYFTNALYDGQQNLRFFGLTGQKEVAGSGAENQNYLRISEECLIVENTIDESSCASYTSPSGKYSWNASGTYTDTVANPAQCGLDSILQINLTIPIIDVAVTQSEDTLMANASNQTYQWINCDSANAIVPGATNQFFVPEKNGTYAVIVDTNGCSDTSACFTVMKTGIGTYLSHGFNFKIYPNPAKDIVLIQPTKNTTALTININDLTGKRVYRSSHPAGDQLIQLRPQLSPGIYLIQINTGGAHFQRKLVIE